MSGFGSHLRITTFGESHGKAVGCVIENPPPQLQLSEDDIQPQLSRRRPGQSKITTSRQEADQVQILSGTEFGRTLGSPIALLVWNKDHKPQDYSNTDFIPRPSHADFTYQEKYGVRAASGGGRASARETIGRVAAGAVMEKWLLGRFGVEIVAWVSQVGPFKFPQRPEPCTREQVDSTIVRIPEVGAADEVIKHIEALKAEGDSTGGKVYCVIRNVPAGWGEPCFDKLEAQLALAMLSIPSTKGFQIGSGFEGCAMKGSEHNDSFTLKGERLGTTSNNSGGIQGGISNGEDILFEVAFKPPATIAKEQQTSKYDGTPSSLAAKGRHDPCVVPRAVPIVEAMAALVLADAAYAQLARKAAIIAE